MTTLDFQTLEEELIAYGAMTENETIDSISEITDEEIAEEKAYRDMIMFDKY